MTLNSATLFKVDFYQEKLKAVLGGNQTSMAQERLTKIVEKTK